MRYIIFTLIYIATTSIYSQEICKEDFADFKCSHANAKSSITFRENNATTNYNIIYHRASWQVDPNIKYIKGSIFSLFKTKDQSINELVFDLSDNMIINEITYHNLNLNYIHQNNELIIQFPQFINPNTLDSLTVNYEGSPDSNGFGSFETATHDGVPILWTLSEPYGSRDWWPNKMSLVDKIDSIDIFITTADQYKAGSNGLLVGDGSKDGFTTYHWKHRYPIASYLVGIAVTNYAIYNDLVPMPDGSNLTVLNYVYPENLENAKNQTKEIIPIIQLYNQLTIPYPFAKEKYGHAQFQWGGGMEHQTMSFMVHFGQSLMAHECAHQWFGDYITCGSWEDIWLNEGFASYFEGLTQEAYYPAIWEQWKFSKLNSIVSKPDGSVRVNDTSSVSRIFSSRLTYNKGAYVLHMMRWVLGDQTFYKAIQNYLKNTKLAGGFARTPDLIKEFENASGYDLTKFFDQWYYKEGYPSYSLVLNHDPKDNKNKLTIYQSQSDPSVNFFEMPVPVQFFQNGIGTTLVFDHKFSGQEFPVALSGKIDSLKFDPELWLISANNNIAVGTKDIIHDDQAFDLYPNPGNNDLYITSKLSNIKQVGIIDLIGNKVYEKDYNSQGIHIDIAFLPTGYYTILIKENLNTYSKKWIKK